MIEKCSDIIIETEKQHIFHGIINKIDPTGINVQSPNIPITSSIYINKIVHLRFELFHNQFIVPATVQSISRSDNWNIRFTFLNPDDKLLKILGGSK